MRRSAELIGSRCSKPVFLMHVPTSWQSVTAQRLYRSELRRLGRFMVGLGGRAPSQKELADTMREYDQARSALRGGRGGLTARQYSESIAHFRSEGKPYFTQSPASPTEGRIPVALVGGPLKAQHFSVFDSIEKAGGTVVLDATTSGERTLPRPFDRCRLREDPFEELADAYFGCIPDAFRRPNSMLYQWLKKELAQRGVRGIVFRYYLGCDTWHAEAQRLKQWAGVPVYILDSEGEESISPRTVNGLGSFLEMLK
jgi:benzoyl-CoA reductase/2-hydroxyglutaryl-CoA dehydratase subunit BcrC/BadD/HgdB